MQDLIVPVNNEAMARALTVVVGEQNTKLVLAAYKALDEAMVFGYQRGCAAAVRASEEEASAAVAGSYNAGYDAGCVDGQEETAQRTDADDEQAYNDGYIDGVSDARVWPSYADEKVSDLCFADEYYDEEFFRD